MLLFTKNKAQPIGAICMNFIKIKIVSPRDVQSVDNITETLLINVDHIVSIKPIRMVIEEKVVDGYWLRMTNGKKYRATEIPSKLINLLDGEKNAKRIVVDENNSDTVATLN